MTEERLYDFSNDSESVSRETDKFSESDSGDSSDSSVNSLEYTYISNKINIYNNKIKKYKKMLENLKKRYNKKYKIDIAIIGTEKEKFRDINLTLKTNIGIINSYYEFDLENKNLQGVIITYNPDEQKSRTHREDCIAKVQKLDIPYIVLSLNEAMDSIRQNYYHINNEYDYQKPLLELISMIANYKLKII